jgi:hypothetical protein
LKWTAEFLYNLESVLFESIEIHTYGSNRYDSRREAAMSADRDKLIDEIGKRAMQYDMEYGG